VPRIDDVGMVGTEDEPRQMPPHVYAQIDRGQDKARVIADYVAGMTDRFALEEYKKLFDPYERV